MGALHASALAFRLLNGRRVARARRSEHSCCTGRSMGHLSTLGPYCRARASNVRPVSESLNSRQNTILSGIQAFFWSRGRSRRSRKAPTASEKDPVRLLGPILRSGRHETKPTAEANSAHRPRKVRQRHTTHVERKRAGRQPLWTPHRSIIVPAMEPNSLPAAITSFPNPAPPRQPARGRARSAPPAP